MPPSKYETEPFADAAVSPDAILASTKPGEAFSPAGAEVRLAEISAHIAAISREIEDKSKKRGRAWATDPHAAWKKSATAAREELYREERMLRGFLDRCSAPARRLAKTKRKTDDLTRQEVDRSTREARKASKDAIPLWNLYLRVEVALLTIIASGMSVGPLGESLLYSAQNAVPEWYRDQWLHTEYGTTWGKQAEALRSEK